MRRTVRNLGSQYGQLSARAGQVVHRRARRAQEGEDEHAGDQRAPRPAPRRVLPGRQRHYRAGWAEHGATRYLFVGHSSLSADYCASGLSLWHSVSCWLVQHFGV